VELTKNNKSNNQNTQKQKKKVMREHILCLTNS